MSANEFRVDVGIFPDGDVGKVRFDARFEGSLEQLLKELTRAVDLVLSYVPKKEEVA